MPDECGAAAAQRGEQQLRAGEGNIVQVARSEDQCPAVDVWFFLQRKDLDLLRVAEVGGRFRGGGGVGIADGGRRKRAQKALALVKEKLGVVSRGIHLPAIAGNGIAERPVQDKNRTCDDARQQRCCEQMQQQRRGAGDRLGVLRGSRCFLYGHAPIVGMGLSTGYKKVLKVAPARDP
ncbi:hypothetical protein D3C72_1723190 [compost metagenome]